MLDDHDGVAGVYQLVEYAEEFVYIGEVETGGGLVEDVQGLTGAAAGQLAGELDALGLAAGKLGGGLAELDVAHAHLLQRLQVAADGGDVLKELQRLADAHVQDFVDVLAFVFDLEGLSVVAAALADFAGYIHIGQEVHLDLYDTVTAAGLAAAAFDVEAEAALVVSAYLSLGHAGEEVADGGEHPGVGGGIGAGGAADGRLVDIDDLVDVLQSLDGPEFAGGLSEVVDDVRRALVQDFIDEAAFAGAGDARDADEFPQGEGHVDVLEVVFLGAAHREEKAVAGPSEVGHADLAFAGEVLAGDGAGAGFDILHRALGYELSAVDAGAGADVHDVVGHVHGVLVVFHHDEGVADVRQVAEGGQQHGVVLLVEADAGFVQDVEDAHEAGADLRGEADALGFTAGERAC